MFYFMRSLLCENGSRLLRARELTELRRNAYWKLYCCRTTCRSVFLFLFCLCFSPHLFVIVAVHWNFQYTFSSRQFFNHYFDYLEPRRLKFFRRSLKPEQNYFMCFSKTGHATAKKNTDCLLPLIWIFHLTFL